MTTSSYAGKLNGQVHYDPMNNLISMFTESVINHIYPCQWTSWLLMKWDTIISYRIHERAQSILHKQVQIKSRALCLHSCLCVSKLSLVYILWWYKLRLGYCYSVWPIGFALLLCVVWLGHLCGLASHEGPDMKKKAADLLNRTWREKNWHSLLQEGTSRGKGTGQLAAVA